jgi:hypothetical protein
MVSNLRPDLTIEQKFQTVTPVFVAPSNPVVLFGVCRQMAWREDAGQFQGGQVNPSYNFPGLSSGAVVEQPASPDPVLRPHVFIQNRFGVAEVTPSYNWGVIPPTFDLAPSLSAVFEISEGTTGDYAASSGAFTDVNADFIEDEVAAGDVILVNDIPTFDVAAIVSDTELTVTKIDKIGPLYSGDLTIADPNGDRIFTDLTVTDFEADGVIVGDLIGVAGWAELYRAAGLDYTAAALGVRTMTGSLATWLTSLVTPFIPSTPGTAASGCLIWANNTVDWVPAFSVTTVPGETSMTTQDLLAAWPGGPVVGNDEEYEIWNYIGIDLTGASVFQDTPGSWAAGVFTIANPAIDFLAILTGPLSEYFIVVHDADGRRPVFAITAIGPGPAPVWTVNITAIDSGYPAAGGPVTWELWQINQSVTTAPLAFYYPAVLSAGVLDIHTIILDPAYTTAGADFSSILPVPAAGDIIYDDTGVPLFTLVTLDSPVQITVQDIVSGTLPAGDSAFGFRLCDLSNVARLRVTNVSPTSLTVRNILTDPPTTAAYPALYYTIGVADSLSDVSYTIEKTLSGALLDGTVLCTFTARRNDYSLQPIEITDENRETMLGKAVPANPLGLAASIALANSGFSIYALMVENDLLTDWQTALTRVASSVYYILVPLTQNENVLSAVRAHVAIESTPEKKRDRIAWQSHLFERIETRIDQPAGTATYIKTATTTTVTIAGIDVEAYGTVLGDVFESTTPAGGGRIISMVTGVNSVLTIVNDNGLPVAPFPGSPINGWLIRSKDLTDEQFADKIAAYPATIKDRRIRNLYPDTCEVTFTDDTDPTSTSGFYGGGDVTEEVPAYYVCAMEGAKRAAVKPAQSLTQYFGTGINRLVNPFGDPYGGNEPLNDKVLDGGNYLMSQPVEGGSCSAVRAISTDVTEIYKMEDSAAVQIDNFARLLRTQIRPMLGPNNIDDLFFDLVSTKVNAVRGQVLDAKDAREIDFLSISEDPNFLDTFRLDFDFVPFVAAAKARVTIYI